MSETLPLTEPANNLLLARVGRTGVWGNFSLPAGLDVASDTWVVCQTGRGTEMGLARVTLPLEELVDQPVVGNVLRVATPNDHLINDKISRTVAQGIEACNEWLSHRDFDQMVLDVDVPLDGQRLYFHFLGEVDGRLDAVTEQLVEIFDQATGVRRFTQAVLVGCGPSCGSDGSGCGAREASGDGRETDSQGGSTQGGCAACGLSGRCQPRETSRQESR